ncbi:ABC-2 type transport system permease protein [Saccharothrix ecbatanensis]|uniref:ABC-2 type transport system permease protein n=1 Tax=Saccharothrix ecbatanensis TaxID=1105145 RepID=A0A7W9HPX2_9PSEU|nr:ABC-2 family transporter protein [Saccharothrix ecbatanensis]MBB5806071.1 ABC-2 type transport system permease protein [Saccharothrix ecbatanensis]
MRAYARLALAGFRRYSTYRQAMVAGMATNVAFGLLRMAVLVAAVSQGSIAGYDVAATATYVWLGQGLMAVVVLWGDKQLADRIRSGDVVVDLYRPWHLQSALLAEDVGRAGYALLVRLAPPIAFGALFFPFRWPELATLPLFAVSVVLAVAVSFGMRFLLNATTFWLLDNRGVQALYTGFAWLLSGLAVPLAFFPSWALPFLWSTPFAAMLQAPIDVFLERGSPWPLLAGQAFWAVVVLGAGHLVLQRAVRKVVVQGG